MYTINIVKVRLALGLRHHRTIFASNWPAYRMSVTAISAALSALETLTATWLDCRCVDGISIPIATLCSCLISKIDERARLLPARIGSCVRPRT